MDRRKLPVAVVPSHVWMDPFRSALRAYCMYLKAS